MKVLGKEKAERKRLTAALEAAEKRAHEAEESAQSLRAKYQMAEIEMETSKETADSAIWRAVRERALMARALRDATTATKENNSSINGHNLFITPSSTVNYNLTEESTLLHNKQRMGDSILST
jgi:hypothetical protein